MLAIFLPFAGNGHIALPVVKTGSCCNEYAVFPFLAAVFCCGCDFIFEDLNLNFIAYELDLSEM
jgi:hypothetical protein